jgi:hypothetical protein
MVSAGRKVAGSQPRLGERTVRVTVLTAYTKNGGNLGTVEQIANP